MNKDVYRNDRLYLMTMSLAGKLLREGSICEDMYLRFERKMQEKYSPTYSKLFTDIALKTA